MPQKERRVAVTERAIIQRVNRKFVSEYGRLGRELKKTRGERAKLDLGDFYILDKKGNFIWEHHVDPEETARDMEVLADWEYLAEGEN